MKTRFLSLLLAALLLFSCALPAAALHVFDANQDYALTDEQIRTLEATAQRLDDQYGVYAMIALTDDLNGAASTEAWALAKLNAERGDRDGIVLGVYDNAGKTAFTTQIAGDGAAARFPKQMLDTFEQNFASQNRTYFDACSNFYNVVEAMLQTGAPAASAAPSATTAPAAGTLHVFDSAYLLKDALPGLETRAAAIEADTGFCPMILLCDAEDLDGMDLMDYAETRFANETDNTDGLVMLVSVESDETERLSIVPMGRGEYYFDSDRLEALGDDYDAADSYAAACSAFLDTVSTTLTQDGWSKAGAFTRLQGNESLPLLVDDAKLLSDADAAALLASLNTYSDELNCDLVVVTTNTTEDLDAKGYADRFFDAFGYGRGADRSGVLFLLSMEDRAWAISTTGEAADKAFGSESKCEAAVERVAGALRSNDFSSALPQLAETLHKGVYRAQHPFVSPVWLLVSLAVAFVISYLIQTGRAASLKSVQQQVNATAYLVPDSLELTEETDDFIRTDTSRSAIPKSSPSSSSRGSSSGGHGGGSGHF